MTENSERTAAITWTFIFKCHDWEHLINEISPCFTLHSRFSLSANSCTETRGPTAESANRRCCPPSTRCPSRTGDSDWLRTGFWADYTTRWHKWNRVHRYAPGRSGLRCALLSGIIHAHRPPPARTLRSGITPERG